ncbi:MAG TPA: Gfo/Idh/MocA family oxidoreductase [Thermoanaerobaculia bacterium]|nr:Gfo/Idh/MocA family oxidoreductase [Thermoanaerobaculia bacterium]
MTSGGSENETPREIRVAVVGVGHLGRHHARIASAMRGVRCVGVLDRHDGRADEVARAFGLRILRSLEEVAEAAEAAVIATPTVSHAEIAQTLIDLGCDVMIEKPIAANIPEADAILRTARAAGRIVQVGQVERYNPAVQAALAMAEDVRFVQAHRLGVFTRRSLDVDVVLDLMIHDLQIVQALSGRHAEDVRAVGMPVLTDKIDLANARIAFEGGFVADLTASRVSVDTVRELHIFGPAVSLAVDMRAQSIRAFRLSREGGDPAIVPAAVPVEREEPLVREMADFVRAVRDRAVPLVSGETGRDALLLATRVQDAIERHRAAFEGAPA